MQSAFVTALLKKCKNEGFHTAVDTCGMVRWEAFEKALPYVNLFLFDIKHMDAKLHEEYTGASNEQILENLRRLNDNKVSIEIRMPIIPTYTTISKRPASRWECTNCMNWRWSITIRMASTG